jgi:putative chitinase
METPETPESSNGTSENGETPEKPESVNGTSETVQTPEKPESLKGTSETVETPGKKESPRGTSGTVLTAAITGFLTVLGTIGAAYLTGNFSISKTEKQTTGTIDLEKLKFANELVKTALSSNNPATSLKFYADIGLLSSLKVDAVQDYAKAENQRLKTGSSSESVLPQFGNLQHSFNWLDKDFFVSFAPKARDDVVTTFVTTGNYILQGYNLNSSITRLSYFLGQLAEESAGFTILAQPGSDEAMNKMWDGRTDLGNVESGDGAKFRPRGLLEIVGKANYTNYSEITGIDLVSDPNIAANPQVALLTAAAYWTAHNINEAADRDDVEQVTRLINGGLTGLEDRKNWTKRARDLLEEKAKGKK